MNHVKRLIKAYFAIVGYEYDDYVEVGYTDFIKLLKRISPTMYEELYNNLKKENFIMFSKFRKGQRVVIKKDPEYEYLKNVLLNTSNTIDIQTFEKLFIKYFNMFKNPLTGYADLGLIRDAMIRELGISDNLFIKLLSEFIMRNRSRVILTHGGSFRIKLDNVYVGLVKVIV